MKKPKKTKVAVEPAVAKKPADLGIQIESGIPVPPKGIGRGIYAKVLQAMKPGDSFTIPYGRQPAVRMQSHKTGIKITIRRTSAEGEARVWRLE